MSIRVLVLASQLRRTPNTAASVTVPAETERNESIERSAAGAAAAASCAMAATRPARGGGQRVQRQRGLDVPVQQRVAGAQRAAERAEPPGHREQRARREPCGHGRSNAYSTDAAATVKTTIAVLNVRKAMLERGAVIIPKPPSGGSGNQ